MIIIHYHTTNYLSRKWSKSLWKMGRSPWSYFPYV